MERIMPIEKVNRVKKPTDMSSNWRSSGVAKFNARVQNSNPIQNEHMESCNQNMINTSLET